MSKQDAVCTECKSDRIVLDAWAVWDIEQQDWVISEIHDEVFCRDCGNAEFELIDIEEEE
tara:strand:- start:72 stop:251 length:180 start_codon:yes stop_codon:yes gene_type:complete